VDDIFLLRHAALRVRGFPPMPQKARHGWAPGNGAATRIRRGRRSGRYVRREVGTDAVGDKAETA